MNPEVMVIGRLNPPTAGHEVLVDMAVQEAKARNTKAVLYIVDGAITAKDKARNPLSGDSKLAYAKKLFPQISCELVNSAYHALEVLDIQGKSPGVWITGSDRASECRRLLKFYGLGGEVIVVDREGGDADGVSATAARKAALEGDWDGFVSQMPKGADTALLADLMKEICEETTNVIDAGATGRTC
jgi:hypothetical protein